MRYLSISYKTIVPVYPSGDNSIVKHHLVNFDQTEKIERLLDFLLELREGSISDVRILGEAEDRR